MRALKTFALVVLLIVVLLSSSLAWLVRSEAGSRWLLEQGLRLAPLTIEVKGVSGTLTDGLAVESLFIGFPTAEVQVDQIVVSWQPISLFGGVVDIDDAHIGELSVDVVQKEVASEPPDDRLFWLRIPLDIYIAEGQIDKLRIQAAEFEDVSLIGSIGHGRLEVESLTGQIAGATLQVSGELAGPAPGSLRATGSWQLPSANLNGAADFSGDIEKLAVSHVLHMPDQVDFAGSIFDLFTGPTLAGVATWDRVRLPGAAVLHSEAGNMAVSSDFRTASIDGTSVVVLEGWPAAPLSLQAEADLQGIAIDSYVLALLGGQLTGSGRIDYRDGVSGQLGINGVGIDTGLLNENTQGQADFNSILQLESTDTFDLQVVNSAARIAGNELEASGSVKWLDGELAAVVADAVAGVNELSADIKLGEKLAGTINADMPNLATAWPGLQGSLNGDAVFSGSRENPEVSFNATGTSLAYANNSLAALAASGKVQPDSKLTGRLRGTELVIAEQKLGKLEVLVDGTLAEHKARLSLTGNVVNVDVRAAGGWDGEQLLQRFEYGKFQPDGFDSWMLEQEPELRVSAAGGQLAAHCWKQLSASICLQPSSWGAGNLQAAAVVDGFLLASLKPLLADGYSIDGTVDAALEVVRDSAGLRGGLHWQQSRTTLGYADEFDEFFTELDQVSVDVTSDDNQTDFVASIQGEEGLMLTATAKVTGPPIASSPLQAAINGKLPSIGLLRPLLRRVVEPGELRGELTIGLDVSGTVGDPVFIGGAKFTDGAVGLLGAGITLSDINIAADSAGSDKLRVLGQLRSGGGSAEISGDIHSETDSKGRTGLVADISLVGEGLATVRNPDLTVDTSPDLRLRIAKNIFDISGAIFIPYARAEVRDLPAGAVARSDDVIVHSAERIVVDEGETIVTGNVEVALGDDVRFRGFGLDSRLEGGLNLKQGRDGFLRTTGTVRVRDGFLMGYGKELRVDRGELTFTGPLDDPLINIQVSRESIYKDRQYTVGLRLSGSAQNVKTDPFSRPGMSNNDVLSFLLIDQPTGADSDASGAAVALGLGKLLPGDSGKFGLDEVGFETNDANEAAMVAGKRINDDIYVRYVFGSLGEPGAFRIRYRLGRGFSLEASTGARQSLDVIYLLER
ncbi:translocation/assembly module TamB domain-containing protein [Gammaproteobacteria bacterium]|nr:translocation/assembly module TamB domain-containing protein [Gammaproteobacteria bacterium]